jgi:LPXTG-motif cell wall-anchored protein
MEKRIEKKDSGEMPSLSALKKELKRERYKRRFRRLLRSTVNGKEEYNYRVATAADTNVIEEFEVANGMLRIAGLDSGTYYLEETKAPAGGYNPLEERQSFTIDSNNIDAIMSDGKPQQGSGVQVVNKSGTILPGTGGLGTLLFTVLGGSTVLGSGVVLVTKKRMSKIVDED